MVVGFLALAVVCWSPMPARSSESAQARLWCWSLHFQQGSDSFGDTLDLSTIAGTPNGELAPYNGIEYVSAFALDSQGFPVTGTMFVNLPAYVDNNNNGWPDFFEVSQPVSAVTFGNYTTPISSGNVTATWSRGAGAKDGTCQLELDDNVYGSLGQFRHSFALIEYTGPLVYTPATNVVNGQVTLTKTGDSASQLIGPVQFVKLQTDRFNELNLQAGNWINAQAQALSFTNSLFLRNLSGWPTNYYGEIDFADGDPATPAPDYLAWGFAIVDTNDANQNGIPDFSDDPVPAPPRLALFVNPTNLLLTIDGDVGTICQIQASSSLAATNWQPVRTLTLTNDPQTIALPLGNNPTAFFRIQVQ